VSQWKSSEKPARLAEGFGPEYPGSANCGPFTPVQLVPPLSASTAEISAPIFWSCFSSVSDNRVTQNRARV
jgi:hypothetical protein